MVHIELLLGLAILLLAGDALVRGAVALSLRLGVPKLIVGLTIVAFGTSAPELLVSVQAALHGAGGLALGNVVGSNIINILVVLGLPALISGIRSGACDSRRDYGFMLGVSVVFLALLQLGPLTFWHGAVLLVLLAAMLRESFASSRRHMAENAVRHGIEGLGELAFDDPELADPALPGWRIALYIVLGLAGLPLGANLTVDAAVLIAADLGVSDRVIGLTVVAIGTSLPELATTVTAALRREADVVMGNAIGSNMFNILAIMGVTSMFGPVAVPAEIVGFDMWVMLAASALLAPFVFLRRDIGRLWGAVFLALYGGYVWAVLA